MNIGFGPFYDGLTHLFVTPEDLLQVVALALLAGLRGPRFGRAVLFALPTAWFAGSIAGLLVAPLMTMSAATAVIIISLGALVAGDRPLSVVAVAAIAVAIGLLNGVGLAKAGSGSLGAGGIVCALFVVVSLLAGQVTTMRALWGAHSGAGRGKLDRRQRPLYAGLGHAGSKLISRAKASTVSSAERGKEPNP